MDVYKQKITEKHGMTRTPIYRAWGHMRERCCNPNNAEWRNYGGRGIGVCDEWLNSFLSFFNDMGNPAFKGAHLDRINNNSGYSKENCRWVSVGENVRNTRRNRIFTAFGKTMCLSEWSRELGIHINTLSNRFHRGWKEEDLFKSVCR